MQDNDDKILERASGLKVKANRTKDDAWEQLNSSINKKNRRYLIYKGLAAASILLAIVLVIPNKYEKVYTSAGENKVVYLPDSSKVTLNAASKLTYSDKSWSDKRSLTLDGEAFFEIEKGSDLHVNCKNGKVRVLGTSFNVYSRSESLLVECFTGKVEVLNPDGQVVLEPYMGARLLKGEKSLEAYQFTGLQSLSWLTGSSSFHNHPLELVFNEIEHQYGYSIILNADLNDRKYSGFFKQNNLEQALQTVCWPMELSFEVNSQKKIITIK